jgi:hypothetical protein
MASNWQGNMFQDKNPPNLGSFTLLVEFLMEALCPLINNKKQEALHLLGDGYFKLSLR